MTIISAVKTIHFNFSLHFHLTSFKEYSFYLKRLSLLLNRLQILIFIWTALSRRGRAVSDIIKIVGMRHLQNIFSTVR